MQVSSLRDAGSQTGLLDGTWLVVAGQLGGVRLPDNAFNDLTLTVRNGQFELGLDRGHIVLDRAVSPAALDVVIVSGPDCGRFLPAIVERAGSLLRICYDLAGTRRPATFQSLVGTRYFLATYRRAGSPTRHFLVCEVGSGGQEASPRSATASESGAPLHDSAPMNDK